MTIERHAVSELMSQAVVHGDTVYLAGQVALDKRGADTATQTQEILSRIDALLATAGSDRSKLLTATIWLGSPERYNDMNRVWAAWFEGAAPPARATICNAVLAAPGYDVEIMVIAAR